MNGAHVTELGPTPGPRSGLLLRSGSAAVVLGLLVPLILVVGHPAPERRVSALVLVAAQAGSLRWLVRRPEWTLAVTAAAGLGLWLVDPRLGPASLLAGQVALCALSWLRPADRSVLGAVAMIGLAGVGGLRGGYAEMAEAAFAAALAWGAGQAGRGRQVRQVVQTERALAHERARIARELHDVVAHNVTVMVVQATAANHVFDAEPARAREALLAIDSAGRSALEELRLLLRTLRVDLVEKPHDQPQPGLDRLDELAERMRSAGLDTTVHIEGERVDVPEATELTAYRIVQEALTNTLRHAHAHRADVLLSFERGLLRIVVTDDGRPGPAWRKASGQGIAGMRERAALLGGRLDAEPGTGGGFRVCARLPLRERS